MAEAWDRAVEALRGSYDAVVAALSNLSLDPATWTPEVYLVAAGVLLVIVLLLAMRWRGRTRAQGPQFLLTNGYVVLQTDDDAAAPADGGARRPAFLTAPDDARFQLRVTFNNLNAYPVQLLEIALRTGTGRVPVVAEASAVVPPNGAVDVVADVRDLPGERGVLQAFVFATKARPQNLRVSVPLEWEPWNLRYRVKATQQRVEPSSGVASERVSRMEKAAARRDARRERFGSAAKDVGQGLSDAWAAAAERMKAAAAARRARARAAAEERARRRPTDEAPSGPISVPLPPSRRQAQAAGSHGEPAPYAWGGDEASAMEPAKETRTAEETRAAEETRPEEATRPAEDVEVGEPREEEPQPNAPRRRLEFPDEF